MGINGHAFNGDVGKMTSLEINFANILDIQPRPVSCMRLNDKTKQLALYRGGEFGSIELWDVAYQPCLVNQLIDLELVDGKPSVESIVWIRGRLFSAGLHGFIVEHDLRSLKMKNKTAATSGPVWCLAVKHDETQLAAGTEDGFINIFDVLNEGLVYLKVLDRQEGRVLCIDWSPCGTLIASGSVDSVRLWDVEKGHAIQRLITGRTKNKETIVWSIIMINENTIVSGDSRGVISFWDARVGVLKFKIVTHKADILTLKLSPDKTQLYAAGVDPIVIIMNKVTGTEKWVKSHPRSMHTNDVMTLEVCGNRLFSGGQDADLIMSSFPPKVVTKFPPLPKQTFISQSNDRILVRQEASVHIWKLPSSDSELQRTVEFRTKNSHYIYSACLSPNGTLFALSTLKYIRIFRLEEPESTSEQKRPTLHRLQLDIDDEKISNTFWHLNFLSDELLVGISADGRKEIHLKIVSDDDTVELSDEQLGPLYEEKSAQCGVESVVVSPDATYRCMISDNHISIQNMNEEEESSVCFIPKYFARVTSVTFHPSRPLLLVTFSDHCVQVYNIKERKIIFSERIKKKFDDLQPFLGAAWIDNGKSAILFQVDTFYLLKLVVNEEPLKKHRKRGAGASSQEITEALEFSITKCAANYKYLAYFGIYESDDKESLFSVEINPNSILEKLPPAFMKKRFGA